MNISIGDDLVSKLEERELIKAKDDLQSYIDSIVEEKISERALEAPNREMIDKDVRKAAFFGLYWVITAFSVFVWSFMSETVTGSKSEFPEKMYEFALEITSIRHILVLVAGPFLLVGIVVFFYIFIKSARFRSPASKLIDKCLETIAEQLYHIMSLIIVLGLITGLSEYYANRSVSQAVISISTMLILLSFIIYIFAGGRNVKSSRPNSVSGK